MKYAGICLGASSISLVVIENEKIIDAKTQMHEGNPKGKTREMLAEIDLDGIGAIIATGRKLKDYISLPSVSEPEALEAGVDFLGLQEYDTIISAGGESFFVFSMDSKGRIAKVQTGNKCASGTGEFFLQQIGRMGLPLGDALKTGETGEPYKISGRCSVFCKSDCTHALNKGVNKTEVLSGLGKMMAEKIIELITKLRHDRVMMIGGASKNTIMLRFLKEKLPELHIPEQAGYFEALGAAVIAQRQENQDIRALALGKPLIDNLFKQEESSFAFFSPLSDFRAR